MAIMLYIRCPVLTRFKAKICNLFTSVSSFFPPFGSHGSAVLYLKADCGSSFCVVDLPTLAFAARLSGWAVARVGGAFAVSVLKSFPLSWSDSL